MDLDGNERASIGLRNNSLNIIQILLDQLTHKKLSGRVRRAALDQLFATLNRVRMPWTRNVDQLSQELKVLRPQIADQQKLVDAQPKGRLAETNRQIAILERMKTQELFCVV